jgi:hypothetical protein
MMRWQFAAETFALAGGIDRKQYATMRWHCAALGSFFVPSSEDSAD